MGLIVILQKRKRKRLIGLVLSGYSYNHVKDNKRDMS